MAPGCLLQGPSAHAVTPESSIFFSQTLTPGTASQRDNQDHKSSCKLCLRQDKPQREILQEVSGILQCQLKTQAQPMSGNE